MQALNNFKLTGSPQGPLGPGSPGAPFSPQFKYISVVLTMAGKRLNELGPTDI